LTDISEISASSFDKEVLHVEEPVVVEFFSHSCPHCIKFGPVYTQLAEALDGEARFIKIDVLGSEANRALAHSRGVRTVPTLEVLYRGRVIGSMVGYHEAKKVVPTVKGFLSKKEENIGPGTSLANVDV
jgi:thioredoxin-like negative regulator of GroEL